MLTNMKDSMDYFYFLKCFKYPLCMLFFWH